MKKESIAIITSGFLPIPATKGGAVENLIVNILDENEVHEELNFTVFSTYDEKAIEISKKYKRTEFVFIKPNLLCKLGDKAIFFIAKNILKKKNSQSYRFILQRLHFIDKVSKNLKKNDYQKVLLENHPTQYLALKWRNNHKKYANRYFYHCHNEFPGEYGCHEIITGTKKIICVSNYIATSLEKSLSMESHKFSVLRNCIDEKRFKTKISEQEREELLKRYHISKDDTIILFTGRIVPEKGVLELIKAVQKIKRNDFKLLIVGSALNGIKVKSKYEEEIEKQLKDIKEKVIFTGFINYEDIPKMYQLSDFTVVPSIWNDPAPLSVIETLVCGLPLVTTVSGGIPEYANKKCAFIHERDEELVDNLTESIEKLISDKTKRREMAEESEKIGLTLTKENYYKNFVAEMSDLDD